MKMAVHSSETLKFYQTTRRFIPEDYNIFFEIYCYLLDEIVFVGSVFLIINETKIIKFSY
jgi:hypothetical protein